MNGNRDRFKAAMQRLGWSIADAARRLEQNNKTVEAWLYYKDREPPVLAVLLIEAIEKLRSGNPIAGKRRRTVVEKIKQLTKEDNSPTEIASKLNLSRFTIYHYAREANITLNYEKNNGGNRDKKKERDAEIIRLEKKGMKQVEIAKKFSLSKQHVFKILKKHRVTQDDTC